jgi:CRISPR/Cas system-associated exonuclease Cas4 (RecB family)
MGFAAGGLSPARRADRDRGPLVSGSYAEVELHAPRLRFVGRADLLSISDVAIEITDYKTGEPDPRHADQLRIYALLWKQDSDLNPAGTAATKLVIVYATKDEEYEAPSETDLEELREALTHRIDLAERDLALRPPPARPGPETCRHCSVKHMCEEYWSALPMNQTSISGEKAVFIDCEGMVLGRNGPRSFVLESRQLSSEMLVRTPTESPSFTPGDRIRLVGVAHTQDDDAEQRVLTITQASEVFVISS